MDCCPPFYIGGYKGVQQSSSVWPLGPNLLFEPAISDRVEHRVYVGQIVGVQCVKTRLAQVINSAGRPGITSVLRRRRVLCT